MSNIKRIIKSYLPKYIFFKKQKKSIAIIGTRRGGTTLFSSLLSSNTDRIIDQPLESFDRDYPSRRINYKKKKLLPKELCQYFYLSEEYEKSLNEYLQKFELGKNSFLDMNFGFFKNRVIYKFTFGGYILENLINLNIQPLILFRHPFTQASSCVRNNWSNYYSVYLDSIRFKKRYLNEFKLKELKKIDLNGSKIEKAIVDWYCSNAELLRIYKNYPTIFYEKIITDSENQILYLEKTFDISINRDKLNRPSGSSFLSERKFVNNIHDHNYKNSHLINLFNDVKKDDLKKIQYIFDLLEITIYDMYSPFPKI
tara:strand:- start:16056 stop:16991 length:936 start_codon:yes stop_codon:yes gene_type:complete